MYKTKNKKKLKEIAVRNRCHTKKRVEERYGIVFNNNDIDSICGLINRNKNSICLVNTPYKKICLVTYNNNVFKVVYSDETKTLKTVLEIKEHDFKLVGEFKEKEA